MLRVPIVIEILTSVPAKREVPAAGQGPGADGGFGGAPDGGTHNIEIVMPSGVGLPLPAHDTPPAEMTRLINAPAFVVIKFTRSGVQTLASFLGPVTQRAAMKLS